MKIAIHNIFFLIAAICFVVFMCFVQSVGSSYQHYTLAVNTLLAVIYFCLLEGFNSAISSKAVAGNVEKIFRNLIALGIVALVSIGICVGITYFSLTASFQQSLYILSLCGALLYLAYAFVLYKKLVHLRKTKRLQRTWRTLNFTIYIGLFSDVA